MSDSELKFCCECGTRLVKEMSPGGFCSNTGRELFLVHFVCPNRSVTKKFLWWSWAETNYDHTRMFSLDVFYKDGGGPVNGGLRIQVPDARSI